MKIPLRCAHLVLPLGLLVSVGCTPETTDTGFTGVLPTATDSMNSTTTDSTETSGNTGDGDGDPAQTDSDTDSDTDTGPSSCGDAVVDPGEECDLGPQNSETGQCTPNCLIATCGDGFVYEGFEDCDDGNPDNTDACVEGCVLAECGDGFVHEGVEMCDDANDDPADACNALCMSTSCGDGIIQEGEQCDDGNLVNEDSCAMCQLPYCGDGFVQAGVEECDDGNDLDTDACLPVICEAATCGDGFVHEGMETCDDANEVDGDACTNVCADAVCGDGVKYVGVEDCDDANDVDDDACTNDCEYGILACQGGSVLESLSPNGDMIVCDDPNDQTCEEDMETLCPPGWGLCSFQQHTERNEGWDYAVSNQNIVVGEIYCRGGSGAGHYTIGPYGNPGNLGTDIALNCGYGSSRDSCVSNYGCNEQQVKALCCAPTPSCGNGIIDDPEEQCDDGNQDEADACLNNCTSRQPNGC